MAGTTPAAWIGQEVLLHLWKSDGLGTEPCEAVLRGIDTLGVTVKIPQRGGLSFYPWSTLREIELSQEPESG